MAHFALLWKARTIEKYRQNYEDEKITSIFMSRSDMPDKTLVQKWRHYRHGMQKRLSRTFSKWYPDGSTVSNFFVSLRTEMKLPSILLRSLYGFIGGLLLTYLGFMFFVFQLSLSEMHATILSSIIGVMLTLGLTFSNRMRCLIFLLVPQLFSRVGRYTLTCYALVLILTGPATNTLRNLEVLSESMACSQERIKISVKHINDSIKKPYNSIKSSLKITVDSMNRIVGRLKTALIHINRLILSIASIIQSGFNWLAYIAEVCNNAIGSPEEKCLKILNENPIKWSDSSDSYHTERKRNKKSAKSYLADLLHALGVKNVKSPQDKHAFEFGPFKKLRHQSDFDAIYKKLDVTDEHNAKRDPSTEGIRPVIKGNTEKPWFCNTAKLSKAVCESLNSYAKFFVPADFTEETFLATIRKKLKTFVSRIKSLIHMQLNVQHTYTFIGNSSSNNQIAAGVITEIRKRADPILTWLSWSSCVTSLFLLLIIFRAKHYQRMFETRSRFDNRFITKEFRELDLKRLREHRETVLPLNTRERAKYVTTTSFRLVASEKTHLNRSAVFMTITTFKLLIHIVADYSLYWVLTTIRYHGKIQSPLLPEVTDKGAHISGEGFVARLLQAFVDTMNKGLLCPTPDKTCLPNPYPPDFKRYCQIGFLIVLLWFFALFEPYGLRMRHLIMGHYRPQRAKDRAAWLYNHVLRTRACFMKYARRRLHREFKYSSESRLTFRRWLQTHTPYFWLKSLLGIEVDDGCRCLLCNIAEKKSDINKEIIKCKVPNCPGSYCPSCFTDIGQLCTICLSPVDYGDFSDDSLEKGSDDGDSDNDDNNDYESNPSTSNKRNLDNGFQITEEDNDRDASKFNTSTRRLFSFLGVKDENDITTPLLRHSGRKYVNNKTYNLNEAEIITYYNRCIIHLETKHTEVINITQKDYNNNVNDISDRDKVAFTGGIFLYSVYEITHNPLGITKSEHTTRFAKYLRQSKMVRRKKNIIFKESKYPMIFSNKIMYRKSKNCGYDNKPANCTNHLNKPKKGTKNNKTNKSNDVNKNAELNYYVHPIDRPSTSKIKTRNAVNRKSITTLSKYWKNIKWRVLSREGDKNINDESTKRYSKCNRKKKRKKITNITSKVCQSLELIKNNKNTGKSRIFAFLDERDWVNSYVLDNDVYTTEGKIAMKTERSIIVNNVMIPRLNLNLSSESMAVDQVYLSQKTATPKLVTTKTKAFGNNAMRRLLRSLVCSSSESNESYVDVVDRFGNNKDIFRFSKAKNHHIAQENMEKTTYSNKQTACSKSSLNACGMIAENDSSESSQIKRLLLNPLSIIKYVYSSLFLSKNKNKADKLKKQVKNINKLIDTEEILMKVHEYVENEKEIKPLYKTNREVQHLQDNRNKKGFRKENKREILPENKIDKKEHDVKKLQRNSIRKETHATVLIKEIEKQQYESKEESNYDKAVTVCPTMVSCACQNVCSRLQTQEFGVQVSDKSQGGKVFSRDVESMTNNPTCTCAAQCHKNSKDVGTLMTERIKDVKFLPLHSVLKQNDVINTPDSSANESSFSSDKTKTDTTICSLASTEYRSNNQVRVSEYQTKNHMHGLKVIEPRRRFNIKVVTKSNQSTTTDRANHCDVSTDTYDWWSPIVERKKQVINKEKFVEKKRKEYDMQSIREKKTFRSKGVSAGGKMVKFRSKTQFIPSRHYGFGDVMSPSRYLLESQKYYNELFYNIFASPRIYSVTNFQQKFTNQERDRSQSPRSTPMKRRGRKTKRLEDSYSPRRNIQTQKKKTDHTRYS